MGIVFSLSVVRVMSREAFEKWSLANDLDPVYLNKDVHGDYRDIEIRSRLTCFEAGVESVPVPCVKIAWKTKETKSHGFRILETSQRVMINEICVLSMTTEHGLGTEKSFSPWVEVLAKALAESLNVTLIIEEMK